MFVVTEAEAAAIRAAFEQHGEFAAAIELRRLFPQRLDAMPTGGQIVESLVAAPRQHALAV